MRIKTALIPLAAIPLALIGCSEQEQPSLTAEPSTTPEAATEPVTPTEEATADFTMPPPAPTWEGPDPEEEAENLWASWSQEERTEVCIYWLDKADGSLAGDDADLGTVNLVMDGVLASDKDTFHSLLDRECAAEQYQPPELGTRDNPGEPVTSEATFEDGVNTYRVSVGYTDTNATDEVLAENMFNDEPGEGEVYITVPITVTYEGPETMTPWLDLSVAFVATDGRSYDEAPAVVPEDLMDIADLYDGGTATGNVAFLVPEASLEGGVYAVSIGWGDDPLFFAAEGGEQ